MYNAIAIHNTIYTYSDNMKNPLNGGGVLNWVTVLESATFPVEKE